MCVIFDLDGTLLDTISDLAIAVNFALRTNRLPELPEDTMKLMVGNGVRPLCDRATAMAWNAWTMEQRALYLELSESAANETEDYTAEQLDVTYNTAYQVTETATIPLQLANAVFADFSEYYREHSLDVTKPYAGIMDLLDELKGRGVRMAVLSNKADHLSQEIVKHFFGDTYFEFVLGMRSDLAAKPDPAGALYLAKQFGEKPEDLLFVGDSMTDMRTAVSAGMTAIGASWGFRSIEELLDNGAMHIIDLPAELLALVETKQASLR